jgi:hypothetical protein
MRIFVVPSWYPTPKRPHWCRWVVPHIDAIRKAGAQVYVIQVDLEAHQALEDNSYYDNTPVFLNDGHLYCALQLRKDGIVAQGSSMGRPCGSTLISCTRWASRLMPWMFVLRTLMFLRFHSDR